MRRVLIIDRRRELARVIEKCLAGGPYCFKLVPSESEAVAAAAEQPFDIVISALEPAGTSPLELFGRLEHVRPSHPLILLTSTVDGAANITNSASPPSTFRCVSSQHEFIELRSVLTEALEQRARATVRAHSSRAIADDSAPNSGILATVRAPRAGPDLGLIGSGPSMVGLLDRMERVAAVNAAVLILGESGTGKELVARGIHACGPLRDRPWVAVNVAAIPDQLLESEVFGHVRGAFTGATQARAGLLASADGGTLFLDEVGDMPIGLQAKLLRVLESGEVRPVGSDAVRKVHVRLIAATHRDLPALIEKSRFREDLYFRLNVLPVVVPPLRHRREDIADLALHFLRESRKRTPQALVHGIRADAMALLVHAHWPGNVRELASVIERLVVLSSEEMITPQHLSFLSERANAHRPVASAAAATAPGEALLTLKQMTDRHVERVLECTAGDKKRTADILGIDLSTLYRWQAGERRGS